MAISFNPVSGNPTPEDDFKEYVRDLLVELEGSIKRLYIDTEGKVTIGTGSNIEDNASVLSKLFEQFGFVVNGDPISNDDRLDAVQDLVDNLGFSELHANAIIDAEIGYIADIKTAIASSGNTASKFSSFSNGGTLSSSSKNADTLALRKALDKVMLDRSEDPIYTEEGPPPGLDIIASLPADQLRTTFELGASTAATFEEEDIAIFEFEIDEKVEDVNDFLRKAAADHAPGEDLVTASLGSKERAVLVSLAFNGGKGLLDESISLAEAIATGDRAWAFYEIRFNTNSRTQKDETREGISRRRYIEASIFGLYNDSTYTGDVSQTEALDIYRTFSVSQFRTKIFSYEHEFSGNVPNNYETLEEALQRAADRLIEDFGEGATNISPLDIQVATDSRLLFGAQRSGYELRPDLPEQNDLLIGSGEADTIFGEGGDDVIQGEGGDDILNGGEGADFLLGGEGNDTYFASDGDTISDTDKKGRVLLDGNILRGGIKEEGSTTWESENGVVSYSLTDGKLTVTSTPPTGQTATITIENFQSGDLGIELGDPPDEIQVDNLFTDDDWDSTNSSVETFVTEDLTYPGIGYTDDNDKIVALENLNPDDLFSLHAAEGDDQIIASAGNEALWGDEGNDIIQGMAGSDMLRGGEGNDILYAGTEDDVDKLFDPDEVATDDTSDLLFGLDGDDFLYGSAGNNFMDGGPGNDLIAAGAGDDVIIGDGLFISTPDVDRASEFQDSEGNWTDIRGWFETSFEWTVTNQGDEFVISNHIFDASSQNGFPDGLPIEFHGVDTIYAGAGDDVVFANGGDDYINLGLGADYANGGWR